MKTKSDQNSRLDDFKHQDSRRKFTRKLFVAGAVSTLFVSKNSLGFNFMFSGYSRKFEFKFSYPQVSTRGFALMKANDGGYLISFKGGRTSNLLKLDQKGKQIWLRNIAASEFAATYNTYGICEYEDESYFLLGVTNSHELVGKKWDVVEEKRHGLFYEITPMLGLVTKVDVKGVLVWQKLFGVEEQYSWNLAEQIIPVRSGGMMVFGTKTVALEPELFLGKNHDVELPWIFTIDKNGIVQSELILKEHDGHILMRRGGFENLYTKPLVDIQGNIYVCLLIRQIPFVKNKDGRQGFVQGWPDYKWVSFLIKLSSDGHELVRFGFDNDTYGLPVIVLSDDGIDLFRKNDSDGKLGKREGFFHCRFDFDLKLLSRSFVEDVKFTPYVVLRQKEDGFHMFGLDSQPGDSRGGAVLAYLDKTGKLTQRHSFGHGTYPRDMVAGDNDNEVVVFYDTAGPDEIKVEKFTLSFS